MSTENLSVDSGSGGGGESPFSAAEEAFFTSGGETEIPREEGDGGKTAGGDTLAPGADVTPKPGDDKTPLADKTPQHVPLAALHEERGKRKALGTEVETLRTQLAETNGKLSILLKLKGGDVEPKTPAGPPSAEDDIFGAVKHIGETQAQLTKRLDDQAAADKVAGEQQTFVNSYRADCDAFEAKPETADFKDAYNHLLNSRAQELMAIGFDNPAELQKNGADAETVLAAAKALHDALIADEFAIAQRALSGKKSPAAIIYALAKQRGYVKKAANGAAQAKAPAEEKLEQIERGQAANKTLNGGGGAGDEMTAERLIGMPIGEYEAWVNKNPAKARALMGG